MAAGMAIAAAVTAGGMTQQQTMVRFCRGVIPSALKMPRSWTRSRVSISTEVSAPSPASTAISSVSRRTSADELFAAPADRPASGIWVPKGGAQSAAQRCQVGPRAGAWPQLNGVVRGSDARGGAAECLPAGVQRRPVRVVDQASDPDRDRPAVDGQGEPVAYAQADLGEKFGVDVHLAGGAEPVSADHWPPQRGGIAVISHDVQVRQAAGHADRVDHRTVVRLGDVAERSRLGADGGHDLPALGACQSLLGTALA